MSTLGNVIKTADSKSEKHVPVVELPETIEKGKAFLVTVSVGKEIPHPNNSEHFIQWIKLYYQADGGKIVYELGTADFTAHGASAQGPGAGPAYSEPHAVFKLKLNKPGLLIAESCCNIHGLWESSQKLDL